MSTHNIYFRGEIRKVQAIYEEKSDLSGAVRRW